jgi:serine/threonine protein phosphatase PrpC
LNDLLATAVPTMTLEFHCASDTGRARNNNEDSAVLDEATQLVVLADGMGGYNAGEVASGMCTAFIKTELGRWLAEASESATDTDVRRAMDICVDNANRAIFNAANSNPQYAGMGTTLVVGVFRENRLLLGHVGDSRCYRLRGGRLVQITHDHSLSHHRRAGSVLGEQEPGHARGGSRGHRAPRDAPARRLARRPLPALLRRPLGHGRRRGDQPAAAELRITAGSRTGSH